MKLLTLLILFWSYQALATDWLCTEEASQRTGNLVQACGVATATTEDQARLKAFDNARLEFNRVCQASDDCRGHGVTSQPKRTSCDVVGNQVRCYRLVEFAIGTLPITQAPAPAPSQSALDSFWARWNAKYLSQ